MTLRGLLRFLTDVLKVYGSYIGIVLLGTGFLMFAADSVGYLSYGDRPGPGWYGFHPQFSYPDLRFTVGFVVFTTIFSIVQLVVPLAVLVTVALRRLRASALVTAFILAPLFGLATLLLFTAPGWYIAINSYFILLATALSVLFAIVVSRPNGIALGRLRMRIY